MAIAEWDNSQGSNAESSNIAGTALNGLTNGSLSAILADIDNATNDDLYVSFWLELGSITPTAGGSVTIRLVRKRGSTYEDRTATIFSGEQMVKPLTTATGVKAVSFNFLRLPGPYVFGVELVNNSGVTLASSANALYYQTHNEAVN
jgi:hypothetical protein